MTNHSKYRVLRTNLNGRNIARFFFLCLMAVCLCLSINAQTKRSLVVGISEYQKNGVNSWGTIHGANDAELIASVLKSQGFKITKICNKSATASRIRKGLNTLQTSCKKGDIVYIHFSCHGQPFEDMDGDEEDGWDESIIPYDALMVYNKGKYEGENHITDDELHVYFQKIRKAVGVSGLVCVVLDACHSGGSFRGEDEIDDDELYVRGTKRGFSSQGKEFRPRINAKGHYNIPLESGFSDIVILEACRSYQSNYEIKQEDIHYGPLSYYVSKVFEKQAIQHNLNWVLEVKKMMDADKRLVRQNMVYETSMK